MVIKGKITTKKYFFLECLSSVNDILFIIFIILPYVIWYMVYAIKLKGSINWIFLFYKKNAYITSNLTFGF
jgi:hypothetical protein